MHYPRLFKEESEAQRLHWFGPVSHWRQFVPQFRHESPSMYSSVLQDRQILSPSSEPFGHVLHVSASSQVAHVSLHGSQV